MDFSGDIDMQCSFCGQLIELAPVNTFDNKHHFCHLVCAKLYFDNIERVKIDMTNYQRLFISKQLSKLSMDIYSKLGSTMFYMLPVSHIDPDDDRGLARDSYITVLMKMK